MCPSPGCRSRWSRRPGPAAGYLAAAVPGSSRCNRRRASEAKGAEYQLDCLLLAERNRPTFAQTSLTHTSRATSITVRSKIYYAIYNTRIHLSNY